MPPRRRRKNLLFHVLTPTGAPRRCDSGAANETVFTKTTAGSIGRKKVNTKSNRKLLRYRGLKPSGGYMTGLKSTLVAAVAALVLSSSIALAQAPATGQAPATAPPAAAPVAVPAAAPKADASAPVAGVKKAAVATKKAPPNNANRTPESLACSAELDAKGIHGKAGGRAAAMRKCVAAAKKGNTTATAPASTAVKKN